MAFLNNLLKIIKEYDLIKIGSYPHFFNIIKVDFFEKKFICPKGLTIGHFVLKIFDLKEPEFG